MASTPLSRSGIAAALLTIAVLGVTIALTGGAVFSPGPLHAADSTPTRMGGVTSHAELSKACSSCHVGPGGTGTMAARCLTCHTDIQRAIADTATLHGTLSNARQCMSCHNEHLGGTASLTKAGGFTLQHERLGFSLQAHVRQHDGRPFTCASCHDVQSFKFEAKRCESCHAQYQPKFVAAHIADYGRQCQRCHDGRDRFSAGRFVHDTTAFKLDGAHTQTTCVACHVNAATLQDFAQAPRTCIGCHTKDDKHRGSQGTDCASCHSTSSWEGATFDHAVFPLDHGGEGTIPCATCHTDRSNYKQYTCYGCHAHSPARVERQHRGEVSTSNIKDCVRCHAGGGGGEGEGGREGRGRDDD